MGRLTERKCGGYGLVDGCKLDDLTGAKKVISRLAAYEDTGLEPERICEFMEKWVRVVELAGFMKREGIEHLRDLVQAEKDGRLVVLPCVPALKAYSSNEIYVIEDGEIYRDHITEAYISQNSDGDLDCLLSTLDGETFSQREIGETVFLTREEAERALDGD